MTDTLAVRNITVEGVDYQIGSIDARKQLHIARRMGPAIVAMLPLFGLIDKLKALLKDALGDETSLAEIITDPERASVLGEAFATIPRIIEALAAMSDQDMDFVVDTCLDVCHWRQETGWARVRANGSLMKQDLSLVQLLRLTAEVIKTNILPAFFTERR